MTMANHETEGHISIETCTGLISGKFSVNHSLNICSIRIVYPYTYFQLEMLLQTICSGCQCTILADVAAVHVEGQCYIRDMATGHLYWMIGHLNWL